MSDLVKRLEDGDFSNIREVIDRIEAQEKKIQELKREKELLEWEIKNFRDREARDTTKEQGDE